MKEKSSGVKSSVAFFCSLLESLGVVGITPEVLRQAKFNNPSAAFKFWRPLHDLICLQLCCFPQDSENCSETNRQLVFQELWKKKDCVSDDEDSVSFVKFFMALWGYPSSSPFFKLRVDTQESRQLLIAFGWLVSHCDVFLRGIEIRSRSLLKTVNSVPISFPFPADVSSLAGARAREAQAGVKEQVARMLRASQSVEVGENRDRFQGQQLMILHGRIGVMFKSLHSLQQCKFRRIHQLNEAQIAACRQKLQHRMYSQYELHLLQDDKFCREHMVALEAEKQLRDELSSFQSHESNFWNWMDTAFDPELESLMQFLRDPKDGCGVFPVPQEILAKLTPAFTSKSKKRSSNPYRFHHRNRTLTHTWLVGLSKLSWKMKAM